MDQEETVEWVELAEVSASDYELVIDELGRCVLRPKAEDV